MAQVRIPSLRAQCFAFVPAVLLAACSAVVPPEPRSEPQSAPATAGASAVEPTLPAPPPTPEAAASQPPPTSAAVSPNAPDVAPTPESNARVATKSDRPAAPDKPAAPASAAPAPAPKATAAPPVKPASPPPLDLKSLETRLKETKAIGVYTKLTLKNQVDDLLDAFRAHYKGHAKSTLAELRRAYDLLVLKVIALLQDADPPLASAIASSREAIWGILSDPVKFATV